MSNFFENVDSFFVQQAHSPYGICLEVFMVVYCFFALAIVCDEYLAPALETLCVRWRVREDVAGATFLAFASAAPEIVINVVATVKSQVTTSNTTSLGISAIIGSGMLAFSVIPAMCCFASEIVLKLKRRPILRDQLFYIAELVILCVACSDGRIDGIESLFLLLVYLAYLCTVIVSPYVRRRYHKATMSAEALLSGANKPSFVHKAKTELMLHRQMKKVKSTPLLGHSHSGHSHYKPASMIHSASEKLLPVDENVSIQQQASEISMPILAENGNECVSEADNYNEDNWEPSEAIAGHQNNLQFPAEQFMDAKHLYEIRRASRVSRRESAFERRQTSLFAKVVYYVPWPLRMLFKFTCPKSGEGEPCGRLYALTFCITICYVAVFSFVLSSIISAWVTAWSVPQTLFGMLLVAIGAEIPDTVESVTMARKTYGSMAVSNCQGSQVLNIGIGLGLPWMLTNLAHNEITVSHARSLVVSAVFQCCIVLVNFALLVGAALITRTNKAALTKWKAIVLIVAYLCGLLAYTLYLYYTGNLVNLD